jgi:hypothetical protein
MANTFMDVPIQTFRMFAQYVADNDLCDEVEQLLKSQGHRQIRISFDPAKAVAELLKQKAAADTKPGQARHPIVDCLCGPVKPVNGNGDSGSPEPPDSGGGPLQPPEPPDGGGGPDPIA